ncbi:hypothetical protein SBA3_900007 [Candidatus Sulfopaludibacter sp. SbA3]|nr:hypothetical protein SBA3_900007 [Candidatus Sulfopaludibacter sp. SbA3]
MRRRLARRKGLGISRSGKLEPGTKIREKTANFEGVRGPARGQRWEMKMDDWVQLQVPSPLSKMPA